MIAGRHTEEGEIFALNLLHDRRDWAAINRNRLEAQPVVAHRQEGGEVDPGGCWPAKVEGQSAVVPIPDEIAVIGSVARLDEIEPTVGVPDRHAQTIRVVNRSFSPELRVAPVVVNVKLSHQRRVIASLTRINQLTRDSYRPGGLQPIDGTASLENQLFINQFCQLLEDWDNRAIALDKAHRLTAARDIAVGPTTVWFAEPSAPMVKIGIEGHPIGGGDLCCCRPACPSDLVVAHRARFGAWQSA